MHPRNRVDEATLQRERRYAGASRAASEAAEAGAPESERQGHELAVEATELPRFKEQLERETPGRIAIARPELFEQREADTPETWIAFLLSGRGLPAELPH